MTWYEDILKDNSVFADDILEWSAQDYRHLIDKVYEEQENEGNEKFLGRMDAIISNQKSFCHCNMDHMSAKQLQVITAKMLNLMDRMDIEIPR